MSEKDIAEAVKAACIEAVAQQVAAKIAHLAQVGISEHNWNELESLPDLIRTQFESLSVAPVESEEAKSTRRAEPLSEDRRKTIQRNAHVWREQSND
jgi:hypothetical protein